MKYWRGFLQAPHISILMREGKSGMLPNSYTEVDRNPSTLRQIDSWRQAHISVIQALRLELISSYEQEKKLLANNSILVQKIKRLESESRAAKTQIELLVSQNAKLQRKLKRAWDVAREARARSENRTEVEHEQHAARPNLNRRELRKDRLSFASFRRIRRD